jgi:hypothetical protein
VPSFETLMGVKTIHEATRNLISWPFRVISWIVLVQGKTMRNQTRAWLDESDMLVPLKGRAKFRSTLRVLRITKSRSHLLDSNDAAVQEFFDHAEAVGFTKGTD